MTVLSLEQLRNVNRGQLLCGAYIRTSSEAQADKCSPEIQEQDILRYADERGLKIVDIYKDTQRYRSGKKMVEPSGTRLDRPEYQRLLKDAKTRRFSVFLAWREDRLYRGYRPMLELLDLIELKEYLYCVELVREHFDPVMAPIKAWMARMELQAKNDRWHMGMTGRIASGKVIGAYSHYGYFYNKETGFLDIDPQEAEWAWKIWRMWGEGSSYRQLHDHLVYNNVPQKMDHIEGFSKSPWSAGAIKRILEHVCYVTGELEVKNGNTVSKIPVPKIVDSETFKLVQERNKRWKEHQTPRRSFIYETAWLEGKVYCLAHEWKMSLGHNHKGPKTAEYAYYVCHHQYRTMEHDPNCRKRIRMDMLDRFVWKKIWNFIRDPHEFESRLNTRIQQLSTQQDKMREEANRYSQRLEEIKEERKRLQRMLMKGQCSEEEFDEHKSMLDTEEMEYHQSLSFVNTDISNDLDRATTLARMYRENLYQGFTNLEIEPTDPDEFKLWSRIIKGILQSIVKRVDVGMGDEIIITTHIDLTNSGKELSDFVIASPQSKTEYANHNSDNTPIPVTGTIFDPSIYYFEFIIGYNPIGGK